MMVELSLKLGYKKENSSSYYPQENGQVEDVNNYLKSILQRTITQRKTNWHILLYTALWAYRSMVNTAIIFSPCQLVHGLKLILSIERKIHSLKLAVGILTETYELEEPQGPPREN